MDQSDGSQESQNNGFDSLIEKGEALKVAMKNSEKSCLNDNFLDQFLVPLPSSQPQAATNVAQTFLLKRPINARNQAAVEYETVRLKMDDPDLFGFIQNQVEGPEKRELRELDKGRFIFKSVQITMPKLLSLISRQKIFLELEMPSFGSKAATFDILKVYSKEEVSKDGRIEFMKEVVLDLDFRADSGALSSFVNSGIMVRLFVEKLVVPEKPASSGLKRSTIAAPVVTSVFLAGGRMDLSLVIQAPNYSGVFNVPLISKGTLNDPAINQKGSKNIPTRDSSQDKNRGLSKMGSSSTHGKGSFPSTDLNAGSMLIEACLESTNSLFISKIVRNLKNFPSIFPSKFSSSFPHVKVSRALSHLQPLSWKNFLGVSLDFPFYSSLHSPNGFSGNPSPARLSANSDPN